MGDREVPREDCTRCGTCCFSESPRHCRVTGDDYSRLGEEAERLVTWIGNQTFMRLANDTKDGPHHCAALVVSHQTGTFLCSIYETRPQVCRDLDRGGPACLGELATKADRPLLALTRMRREEI